MYVSMVVYRRGEKCIRYFNLKTLEDRVFCLFEFYILFNNTADSSGCIAYNYRIISK
jgi:hypothetical protein